MTPHYADETVSVFHGDCLDVLAGLPDASVDAVVTDPPYGLGFMGKEWDTVKASHLPPSAIAKDTPLARATTGKGPAAVAFNGPAFGEWCELWAAECLRVLKPGGHMLAFGGTRTWHRLACAVEDAGFEIRDSIAWMYGSGFPKSLDVSKAIDKRRDDKADRLALGQWLRAQREERGLKQMEVAAHWPSVTGGLTGCVANWEGGFNCPTWDQWLDLKRIIGLPGDMDAEVWRLNGRKGSPGEAWEQREKLGERGVPVGHAFAGSTYGGDSSNKVTDITAPATDEARTWQGWGTALKPAFEPIVVARKPLTGTVAANVLTYGTGALNIDACRIEGAFVSGWSASGSKASENTSMSGANYARDPKPDNPGGRWPANVVLDEDQAAALDTQSGESLSRIGKPRSADSGDGWGMTATGAEYDDLGGASRFFYVAKADATERPRIAGTAHPTVKPLTLMQWLIRLVTPPGGVVLDPFAGSGTTIEACILEGFRCIATEKDAAYLPLIEARIHRRRNPLAAHQLAATTDNDVANLFDLLGEDGDPA